MEKDEKDILKKIEALGDEYQRKFLDKWKNKNLKDNYWEALKFFFYHSFMRGRKDELSIEYYCFTIKVLQERLQINEKGLDKSYEKLKKKFNHIDKAIILEFKKNKKLGKKNSIKDPNFRNEVAQNNPLIKELITPKKVNVTCEDDKEKYKDNIHLGNDEDIMMVLDVLNFISQDGRKNIYNYLKNKIKTEEGVEDTYKELTSIRAIGDKIASFIIRDISLMNESITINDLEKIFPVDTWVKTLANKFGCSDEKNEDIKKYFIEKCINNTVNPIKFAAGLWYLGFHSLDLLLKEYGLDL